MKNIKTDLTYLRDMPGLAYPTDVPDGAVKKRLDMRFLF